MKISRDRRLLIWTTLSVIFLFMFGSKTYAASEFKLLGSDGAAEDEFGESVSISRDVALVGVDGDDDKGTDSGSAYVFRWNGSSWVEEQKLLASDGAAEDEFGEYVSISGDVALVSAGGDDDKGTDSGSAYVFRWNGSSWVEEQKLLASDGAADDSFGSGLSISGDVALVSGSSGPGSVYVFRYNGSSWVEEQKLIASDSAANDNFGDSVSISGDVALVGASEEEKIGPELGKAYVFRWNGSSWIEEQKLLASDGADGDHFGDQVSISGDVALVGAGDEDAQGKAYVFRWNGSSWVEEQKLLASDGAADDGFGSGLSVSGDMALVSGSGKAYVFRWNGSSWVEEEQLFASDGAAGGIGGDEAVSISGNLALLGADGDDDNGIDSGSAYVYALEVPPGKATLISPSGEITEDTPTYTWNAVANSSWYYLWVNDRKRNQIEKWYTADEANCGNGTGVCSVTDKTALADGSCKWWIQTWNVYGYGPWSDAMSFMVDTGTDVPPGKATLISPSGEITEDTPTYTWNAVANSSWYYLWVNDRKGNQIKQWYTADDADCGNGTGVCSVTDKTALADGSCKWWIQTWNVYGYGPWSDAMSFMVDTGTEVPPGKATLISPSGEITEDTPTYTWNAVANSTWYYLWVNDRKRNQIEKWYTADEANCGNGTGRCSVTDTTELADGSCKWWIQTWNEFGYGSWSDAMAFTVDTPPCTNIAGNWHGSETVTITCCIDEYCETDTFSGTDIITIQQNECNISYDIDVSGYGSFSRKGTISGNKIQLSGKFVILQPWCKAKKNKVDINGKVKGDRINLKGSGKVTGKCDGDSFSCTGDSTATLSRLSYSATEQAMTGKEFTIESSTQLLNNCIKILTIMDH